MPADEQRLSLLVGTRDERQVNNPSPVTDYRGSRAPVLIELSRAFVIQNPRQFKPECVWSVVHVILQRLIIHWGHARYKALERPTDTHEKSPENRGFSECNGRQAGRLPGSSRTPPTSSITPPTPPLPPFNAGR